jgi:hypothetical protein
MKVGNISLENVAQFKHLGTKRQLKFDGDQWRAVVNTIMNFWVA